MTQNGWDGSNDKTPGLLLLLDTRDKSADLKTSLADLRGKWVQKSDKPLRTEKVGEYEFFVVPFSTNDTPKTLKMFLPHQLEYHEAGEEELAKSEKSPEKTELFVGQVQSFLVVGTSLAVIEKTVNRISGGSAPCLGEQAVYQPNHDALFRQASVYAWLNTKAFFDGLTRKAAEKKENPQAPNPFELFKWEKVLTASGLEGLKSAAVTVNHLTDGAMIQLFLGVPESARSGIFKILAGEAKEVNVPSFVPANAVKFSRYRIDGQKAWATLEKMLTDISPQSLTTLNFLLETANAAAKDKDPGFDVRKSLINNLGDDMISYEKGAKAGETAASVFLLGSPNAQTLASALKNVLVFLTAQAGAPAEREFLGRKIFSVPVPALPISTPGSSKSSGPRNLHYAASGGYVAFSTDASALEEYLRSSEGQGKSLKDIPGLSDAAQKIMGPGTAFFSYDNQNDQIRTIFELAAKDPEMLGKFAGLNAAAGMSGMAAPEKTFKDWIDLSLLPPFEKVSKYFGMSVSSGGATTQGITYKLFSPTPQSLKAHTDSK
jgi:hypothetical protein